MTTRPGPLNLLSIGLAALLTAAMISCVPPTSNKETSKATTIAQAAKSALRNLPELKLTLPASLKANSSSTSANRVPGRALGDTTNITSVASLKSEAWYELQQGNGFLTFINKAFDFLRGYANTHEIITDTAFGVAITQADIMEMFAVPADVAAEVTADTKLLVSGQDTSHFSIYAKIGFSVTGEHPATGTANSRIDITEVSGGQQISFFLLMEMMSNGFSRSMPFYAFYDTSTGACDMVNSSTDHDDETGTDSLWESLQRSTIGPDGSITNLNLSWNNGVPNGVYTAYGDDIAGGIASLDSWTDDEDETHDSYWGEYYGTNGNLLKRINGDTELWVPIWTGAGAPPVLNLTDLDYLSAPTTVQQRNYWVSAENTNYTEVKDNAGTWVKVTKSEWNSTTGVYSTSFSNDGTNWTSPISSWSGRSIVFQAVANSWTGGDAVYYWQNGSYDQDGNWTNNLYQGYVVPASVAKFGKNFFMTNEYPLDSLLPLQGSYATDYQLIQQEGQTYTYEWTDWDGVEQTDTYTSFQYYLNKNQASESPIRENASHGDIGLSDKFSKHRMYYWVNGEESIAEGYFLRTTAGVPAYFKTPDSTLVNRVDAKLSEAIQTAYTMDLSAYADELAICRGNPVAGKF